MKQKVPIKKLIWNIEKYFMNQLKKYKYLPQKKFGGYAECYDVESLNLLLSHV